MRMTGDIMTEQEALTWIAELFEVSVESIQVATPRDAIPTWDSLGVLTLMAALNERLDLVMTAEELGGMKSVNDILEVLRSRGKLN